MGKNKIYIPKPQLKKLYLKENLTAFEIAKIFSCSDVTILNKLHSYSIKTRKAGRKKFKYAKVAFNGNRVEKAYMFGFRIGDLNVYLPSSNSKIVVVRCHTTSINQIDVFKKIFSKYGYVKISNSRRHSFHVNCYLDHSFDFLLNKNIIPKWIKFDMQTRWAFIAGYVDAEGSFGINQGRGRFKIDSYDYFVLNWAKKFLIIHKIDCKLRRIYRKNEAREIGYWNNNLWRLNINYAKSLEKFIQRIFPYLLHKKRIGDAKLVLKNVETRRINGTI